MSMVPARDPRVCPVCEQRYEGGCHACPGPQPGTGRLYRRGDSGEPGREDYVRFFRLDAFDRLLIETFRDADLEPAPDAAELPEMPGDEPGLARLKAWMDEDLPGPL
jgi:hypothetical protein